MTYTCGNQTLPVSQKTETATSQYLEQVRSYYDTMNPHYLQYVGKTYQAGLLVTSDTDSSRASNLYFASQAGIKPGDRVLDAGCGVCGPSIDIAQNIEDVKIDAITLSPVQANTARELVQQADLANRIQVNIGDFHSLPFADRTFDIVFFFESTGYCCDRQQLFTEVYRVLRPGGTIYIKDVFSNELPLSEQQQQELAEFDRIYVYKTPRISETREAISAASFHEIESRDLGEVVSTKDFVKAMFQYKYGFPLLSDFGQAHYRNFQSLPIYFGQIKAIKPR
jgi:ubiquinone/menaquinone biosynthesis C-methylase UbiE